MLNKSESSKVATWTVEHLVIQLQLQQLQVELADSYGHVCQQELMQEHEETLTSVMYGT